MELIWQSPHDVSPLCPTGDSQKDRPRRLTEHRMAPRAAGRRLGAALTQLNRPDGWVVERERWGSPQYHIKFRAFTQGLCCLSGSKKHPEQVPFSSCGWNGDEVFFVGLWVVVRMELSEIASSCQEMNDIKEV